MEIRIEELGNGVECIHLGGRLDIAGVQAVELKFMAHTSARKKSVLIDLSGVKFLSSIGIRMLVSNAKALSMAEQKIILFSASPDVHKILELSGLVNILPVVESREEALAVLTEPVS